MADQLFEDGKVIEVDGVELECVAVSHQEDAETQERHTFNYIFRPKDELDAERKVAEEEQAEAERQKELNAAEEPAEG